MSLFKNPFKKQDVPDNANLEHAMRELAQSDNARTRESLYKALLASTLIFHGNASGGTKLRDNTRIADGSTHVSFKTIEHPPGTILLPVFTAVEALTSWTDSETAWVALPAQTLFKSIASSNIKEVRVNPFRPGQKISWPGGILTRGEFTALAQGLLPEYMNTNTAQINLASGQKLLVGPPATALPDEVMEALAGYFRQFPELQGGYLFEMVNEGVASSVIGLQLNTGANEQTMDMIMRNIGAVLERHLPPGVFIDFMELDSEQFLNTVQKCGKALLTATVR